MSYPCARPACGSCPGSAIPGCHRGLRWLAVWWRCSPDCSHRARGSDWGSEVPRVSPWPTMRSVIRPPGADYLAGCREATVSKKWSGDYDGGAGNSNGGGGLAAMCYPPYGPECHSTATCEPPACVSPVHTVVLPVRTRQPPGRAMAPDQEASSARLDADSQPPSSGRGPWWLATVGGSSGITALILQDHAVAWAILAGFSAWLIQNVIIAWIKSRNGSPAGGARSETPTIAVRSTGAGQGASGLARHQHRHRVRRWCRR